MKSCIWILLLSLIAPVAALAQSTTPNPVAAAAREIFERQAKYITASAEEMPEDKYAYHPTPDQWTFQKIVSHVAQSDFGVCAMISDMPAPQGYKVVETDPKDKLVTAVKVSFDFCTKALANLQDAKLGDTIKFFGGHSATRARALVELTDDLEDHYSQMASYMRLNGMLPPSARPAKK